MTEPFTAIFRLTRFFAASATARSHNDVDGDIVFVDEIPSVNSCERDSGRGSELDPVISRRADAQVVPIHDLAGRVDFGRGVRARWNSVHASVQIQDTEGDALVMHHPRRLREIDRCAVPAA